MKKVWSEVKVEELNIAMTLAGDFGGTKEAELAELYPDKFTANGPISTGDFGKDKEASATWMDAAFS